MADVKKPIAKAVAKKPETATTAKAAPAAAKTAEAVKTEPVKAETVKAETAKAAEAAKEPAAKKPTAKKPAAKKAEPGKKTAAKTSTAAAKSSTAAKPAAKKTAVVEKMNIQFSGKSYSMEELMNIAKDVWRYDLKEKEADLKNIEIYVKPEESVAYYVINGEVTGSFYI